MPIIDLQRRLREIGRIRIGQQVPIANPKPGSKAKTRPVKLETFRLTSRDQRVIDAAAALYGGEAKPWAEQPGQWEVITQAAEVPILVPPGGLALTQWYELWSGGGCKRRCDGQTEYVGDQGCLCDPEHRDCSIHTRLSVVLSDLQGLGVWRLDTQGWYAATEIGSVVPLLEGAAERGRFLPARLRLEQRQVLRDGKTNKFAVPVIDIDVTVGQMRALVSGAQPPAALADPSTGELMPGEPSPNLTPVPEGMEGPSVGEQMAAASASGSKSRASTPELPPTGRRPRPRAEAEADAGDAPKLGPTRVVDEAAQRAQQIGMKGQQAGLTDDDRHRLIGVLTDGRVESSKEVTPEEAGVVLQAIRDIGEGRKRLVETDGAWQLIDVEDATGDEPEADDPFEAVGDEDGWDGARWREFLKSRGVKVVDLVREANRLCREAGDELGEPPASLEDLKGRRSLCGLLRGWVEDEAEAGRML